MDIRVADVGRGIRTTAPFEWMRETLNMWCELIDRYALGHDDAAYWFSENTNSSLLVSAACCAGTIGLTEYPCEKSKGKGRADFYISQRRKSDKHSCVFETKQAYPAPGSNFVALVGRGLDRAVDDANASDKSCDNRAGALFVVPKVDPSLDANSTRDFLRQKIREIAECVDFDAIAWTFPHIDNALICEERNNPHNIYQWPGIMLLLKRA